MLLQRKHRFPLNVALLHVINVVIVQMHIVNKRKDLTLDEAVQTPNGLAVLGFFIEVTFSTLQYVIRG